MSKDPVKAIIVIGFFAGVAMALVGLALLMVFSQTGDFAGGLFAFGVVVALLFGFIGQATGKLRFDRWR